MSTTTILASAAIALASCVPWAPAVAADVSPAKQRICASVFRYGGAASGWSTFGTVAGHPGGTSNSIFEHFRRANEIFDALNTVTAGEVLPPGIIVGDTFRVNVEWVWDALNAAGIEGAIEDLPDPFGNGNGDFQGGPAGDGNDRVTKPSEGGTTGSPDLDFILAETVDSECYPVVFINSPGSGFSGFTVVQQVGQFQLGLLTVINSNAFPRNENPATFRRERDLSTLAHEFAHAMCLDPTVAGWGDAGGHPPRPQGITGMPPDTPEGRGFVVPAGFADTGSQLRDVVTWFTGVEGSGRERFTYRQAVVANGCLPTVRIVYSPSFSVAPGGVSFLDDNKILWAPAVLPPFVPPPVNLGIASLDALSYDWKQFPQGRFRYKFSVDTQTFGLPNTDVRKRAGIFLPTLNAADEFAAPLGQAAPGNVLILTPSQFGLRFGDDVDALEAISPALRVPDINGMRAIDLNSDGILDVGARVYFSVGPFDPLDSATVYVAIGDGGMSPLPLPYATRAQLRLEPGDDIDALCVRDDGNGTFDGFPTDEILFSLTRNSTNVLGGNFFSSSDVLLGHGLGVLPVVVTPAAALGLRGGLADELDALKCFTTAAFCDINRDGKVDRVDIQTIFDGRGRQATIPGDPRDADGDGLITVNDARVCTLQCTNPRCAP